MLLEEQAAELLRRCESIVGRRLDQVRGNLRNAETRAAAVWELIVLEEASRVGEVEYEPEEGASPDIRLTLASGRILWIEVAFLYPRFWKEERQSNAVTAWITQEAIRRDIPPFKLSCRFYGDITNDAGAVRYLPELHQKKKFLSDNDVSSFFEHITKTPESPVQIKHPYYSIELSYSPNSHGPHLLTGGGFAQEAPKNVKQHAVYRVLRGKSKQHNINGVRLVCVGSDQSPALSNMVAPDSPTARDAVYAAFQTTRSLSGVILLEIEDNHDSFRHFNRIAKGNIYVNPIAKDPLTDEDLTRIIRLNFNRWGYSFRMDKHEPNRKNIYRRVTGNLVLSANPPGIKLEIPANLVIDSLAGKTNLRYEYGYEKDNPMLRCLNEGWTVKACSFKNGDVEKGEAPKVVLELEPPSEAVYWPTEEVLNN